MAFAETIVEGICILVLPGKPIFRGKINPFESKEGGEVDARCEWETCTASRSADMSRKD